jgi:hypothetical protein
VGDTSDRKWSRDHWKDRTGLLLTAWSGACVVHGVSRLELEVNRLDNQGRGIDRWVPIQRGPLAQLGVTIGAHHGWTSGITGRAARTEQLTGGTREHR